MWPGLTEKLSINTLKKQEIQQWDTCTREDKGHNQPKRNLLIQNWKTRSKQMLCFAQLWNLAQPNKERSSQIYADVPPTDQSGGTNATI